MKYRFFDPDTKTVILDGVVVKEGTKKIVISIIRSGKSKDFEDFPVGGDTLTVVQLAKRLSTELGLNCFVSPELMLIPDPLVCLTCGRVLFAGRCPVLLAFGTHEAKEEQDGI